MCQFVRLVKGGNYIEDVHELTRSENSSDIPISPSMNIDQAMTTAPVLIALEIGLDAGTVRNKTLQQILRTGSPYSTAEDLLKAVLDEPESAEDESVSGPNHTLHSIDCAGATHSVADTTNSEVSNTGSGQNSRPNAPSRCESDIREDKSVECTKMAGSIEETNCDESSASGSSVKRSPTKGQLSLEEENRKLKDARLCKVCLDEEVGVVYLPCGHLGA